MKRLNLSAGAIYAAGVGAAVLLFSATFGRTSSPGDQNDQLPASQAIEEPTEEPGAEPAFIERKMEAPTPETAIRTWPKAARVTARAMIGKYGEPSRWSKEGLVWVDNGSWKKTVVHRSPSSHFFGKRGNDYLEQAIAYRVPLEKVDSLARFDRRLEVNASLGLLSARSGSEQLNFLALNLADEIIKDKRGVEDAHLFYLKTARLSKAGKSSPYLNGFLFPSRSGARINERDATDYDRNMMP
jgi:hypothetical protein